MRCINADGPDLECMIWCGDSTGLITDEEGFCSGEDYHKCDSYKAKQNDYITEPISDVIDNKKVGRMVKLNKKRVKF